MKNIMIAGTPDPRLPLSDFMSEMEETKTFVGKITLNGKKWYFQNNRNEKKSCTMKELKDIITSHIVGEMIIFIGEDLCGKKLYEIVSYCRENSINYYVVPETGKLPERGFWKKRFIYIPLIERWVSMRDSLTLITCKRLIDLLFVVMATIVLFPVCLIIACAIKLNDRGPVFYISKRVGKNGKIINGTVAVVK